MNSARATDRQTDRCRCSNCQQQQQQQQHAGDMRRLTHHRIHTRRVVDINVSGRPFFPLPHSSTASSPFAPLLPLLFSPTITFSRRENLAHAGSGDCCPVKLHLCHCASMCQTGVQVITSAQFHAEMYQKSFGVRADRRTIFVHFYARQQELL